MESFVSLGRIHLPIFGLFVAAGLMTALGLALRSARLARVDRDAFWDFCVVTVFSAFLLSRVVLVVEDLHVFIHYPTAVFQLPALSGGGVLLTVVVAIVYMRWRRLAFVPVLEAASAPVALFCAFYELGEYAGGKREGMLTDVPWAVGSTFGRVHPVELYLAAAWLVVCGVLFALLRRQLPRGQTLGWAMILYGLVNALIDFFHLPSQLYRNEVLDRTQWHGIELIVIGGLLLAWRLAVPVRSNAAQTEVHDAV